MLGHEEPTKCSFHLIVALAALALEDHLIGM